MGRNRALEVPSHRHQAHTRVCVGAASRRVAGVTTRAHHRDLNARLFDPRERGADDSSTDAQAW